MRFAASLEFPDFEQDYEFVSLRHPDEYPFNEGRIVSSKGLDIPVSEYEEHFIEEHVPHSNALHSVHKGHGAFHVGPLARYSLNFDRLPAARAGRGDGGRASGPSCRNPFKSIVVRAVELVFACDEALRIIDGVRAARAPRASTSRPRAGTGHGATEAPRGMLYHRYRIDATGLVQAAKIVPPTSQNQKTIENDLWHFVADRPRPAEGRAHLAVRAGDPQLRPLHLLRDALPEAGPAEE